MYQDSQEIAFVSSRFAERWEDRAQWSLFPYRGHSMAGTFRQGDILFVLRSIMEDVRPGDVIVFRREGLEKDTTVVHRVQVRTAAGALTQGDARLSPDRKLVDENQLVGRVDYVERGGQLRPVWRGRAGQLWVSLLRLRRIIMPLLGWPYRRLRASHIVAWFWRPRIGQVGLVTEEEVMIKYVHGQRTVACWQPDRDRFWCSKPYDLVLQRPDLEG